MRQEIGNEVILASAGSGKTYQLSNRIIALLARGAEPSSLLALTFTRKAAGEFARRTLTKLATAAADPAKGKLLAEEIGLPERTAGDFLTLLGTVTRELHRLRLSTLDSFYQSLARTHFFELGLEGAFTLLDERLATQAKARVLQRLLRREEAEPGARLRFLEAFRQATWGREESGVLRELDSFVREVAELYQQFPDGDAWGNVARIWPRKNCPWLPIPEPEEFREAVAVLRTGVPRALAANGRLEKPLGPLLGALGDWLPGVPYDKLGSFFENSVLANAEEVFGRSEWTLVYYRKPHEWTAEETQAWQAVLRYVIGGTIVRDVETSRGVWAILREYEAVYDQLVRRQGRLTFADTARLLAEGERRLDMGFRLDAAVRHWLFDEFQDTSRQDWAVIADNLDAVLSESGGGRSAFFVGDVKQALYGWRGGEHRLLPRLQARYQLPRRSLNATYRSSPAVLALVNAVFDHLERGGNLPVGALAQWRDSWQSHSAAGVARTRSGQTLWLRCEREKQSGVVNQERRLALLEVLLRERMPLERGWSCGVLVEKNSEAREVAAFLRTAGWRVVMETESRVDDNPVVCSALALLRWAAHPSDSWARGVVEMTPRLAAWRTANKGWRQTVLHRLAEDGFAVLLEWLFAEPAMAWPEGEFTALRRAQLLELAREFDATGGRDIDGFAQFVADSTRRESADEKSIQVMTVHKAKGLEFDMVFLPFLEGGRIDTPRKEEFIYQEKDGVADWVMRRPNNAVCELTPVWREHLREREGEACYENLCWLYVALTRARRETVLLTTERSDSARGTDGAEEKAPGLPLLLERTLGERTEDMSARFSLLGFAVAQGWQFGDAKWFEESSRSEEEALREEEILPAMVRMDGWARRRWSRRRKPSDEGVGKSAPGWPNGFGRAVGSCVHALLEKVGWVAEGSEVAVRALLEEESGWLEAEWGRAVAERARELAVACLVSPALQEVFVDFSSAKELWRERAFSVRLDGAVVSGVFDRVIVGKDFAKIFDFKTDDVGAEELRERHAGQMRLYRKALSRLTGLEEEKIVLGLVRVGAGELVWVED